MSWVYLIFFGLMFILAIYTVIPDFLLHYLGIGSWKRQYTPGVAITFDDGPDPNITPQILDILSGYGVNAAFFVVGEKAARYPDLIKLIRERGHQLGAHSHHHQYAWFMTPWETWRDWEECIAVVENLTGEVVDWIRPPWGTFNLCIWLWLKVRRKQAVLWNAEGHDWLPRNNPEKIVSSILKQVQEGSIILLHDAGGEKGAPQNTLQALDDLCRRIVEDKKLPLVKLELSEISGWYKLVFTLWERWEHLFERYYKIESISSTNVFRLSKTRYHGPNLYNPSGQLMAKSGDLVGEIHFNSSRLRGKEKDTCKKGVYVLGQVRRSLPLLASYIAGNPAYDDIQVFFGLTLINQGVQNLGFQVQEMPATMFIRLAGLLQKLIILIYSFPAKSGINKYKAKQPKLIWISRQQLLEM